MPDKKIRIQNTETFISLKKTIESFDTCIKKRTRIEINDEFIIKNEHSTILEFMEKEIENDEETIKVNLINFGSKNNNLITSNKENYTVKGISRDIFIIFQGWKKVLTEVNLNCPVLNSIEKICEIFNLKVSSFNENGFLYFNNGELIDEFDKNWEEFDINEENEISVEIIENGIISYEKNIKIIIIFNEKKYEIENPSKKVKIIDIKEELSKIYGVEISKQILCLINKTNDLNKEKYVILLDEKLLNDLIIIEKNKSEIILEIHLKIKRFVKIKFLKENLNFICWNNENIEENQRLFSYKMLKENNTIVDEQLWFNENEEEFIKEKFLDDYKFNEINIKFKIDMHIFYEKEFFRFKSLDSHTKVSYIKFLLCKNFRLTIPENNQILFLDQKKISDNKTIEDYLKVFTFNFY